MQTCSLQSDRNVFMCQADGAASAARKSAGCIVKIASTHGVVALRAALDLRASPSRVINMRSCSLRWAAHGIRVMQSRPASSKSIHVRVFRTRPDARQAMVRPGARGRFASERDVAGAVATW